MTSINNVDFDEVGKAALAAAKAAASNPQAWASLEDILKNVIDGLKADVSLIATRKLNGEWNQDDADVFLEDQKTLARMRIRAVAMVGMQLAEDIWNAVANVFSAAINKAIGWTLLA